MNGSKWGNFSYNEIIINQFKAKLKLFFSFLIHFESYFMFSGHGNSYNHSSNSGMQTLNVSLSVNGKNGKIPHTQLANRKVELDTFQ